MSLGRFPAGLLAGGIGALILILLGFTGANWIIFSFLAGLGLALLVGLAAGFFIGGNPSFAGRTTGSGALAGLIAGAFLLIGQIIGGVIAANQPDAQAIIQQALSTTSSASTFTPSEQATVGVITFVLIGGCFGLLGVGAAAGLGAAGGAIGGRNNRQAPYIGMPGYDPYRASTPINGYPPYPQPQPGASQYPPSQQDVPPQYPQSGYGANFGQYANPPSQDAPPYPPYPPYPQQ